MASTTWTSRSLSTEHPRMLYWLAGAYALVFAVIGAVLMDKSIGAGILVVALGIGCAAITAAPAHWSERHPDEAHATIERRREGQRRLARRHPAYFFVVVPLLAAADATLRWNAFGAHHSTTSWVIPAVCGLLIGAALGTVMVIRAKRSTSPQA